MPVGHQCILQGFDFRLGGETPLPPTDNTSLLSLEIGAACYWKPRVGWLKDQIEIEMILRWVLDATRTQPKEGSLYPTGS